jgi:hypothetical protein
MSGTSYKSVKFELTGPQKYTFTDNGLPFALFGDDNRGNYYYGIWKPPTVGTYTLKATPYTGSKIDRYSRSSSVITFTFAK